MSKKRRTKQEKIIAQLRKQITQTQSHPQKINLQPKNTEKIEEEKFIFQYKNTAPSSQTQIVTKQKDYSYVMKDIKKTLVVVILVIIINTTFYFILEKNILNSNLLLFK